MDTNQSRTDRFRVPLLVGAALLALTLLGFFLHPGYTFLENDTLFYLPMLERASNPLVYGRDLLASANAFNFTVYDELAIGLHKLSGLGFREVLLGEQFVFRLLAVTGVYLIASEFTLPHGLALLVCAIYSLGATAYGPNLETVTIEPVPRALAYPLLFLSLGFLGGGRHLWAGFAAALAFLFHPISVVPFLAVLVFYALIAGKFGGDEKSAALRIGAPLLAAIVALVLLSRLQTPPAFSASYFERMDAWWAAIHRERVSYNWISSYGVRGILYYLIASAIAVLAFLRFPLPERPAFRFFLLGLPAFGLLSVPVSVLFYERLGFAVLGGVQPMRALLWVQLMAIFLPAIAGARASMDGRRLESLGWFALAFLPALRTSILNLASKVWMDPQVRTKALLLVLFALAFSLPGWFRARRRPVASLLIGVLAVVPPFFVLPTVAPTEVDRPVLHTPELEELAAWAQASTSAGAVFVFPDAGMDAFPAVFRAIARRAVYVDWKGAGQAVYFRAFAEEWWKRWERVAAQPFNPANCAAFEPAQIDYVVLRPNHRIPGLSPVHETGAFLVYRTPICPIQPAPPPRTSQ